MEKGRDVRRGASRLSTAKGHATQSGRKRFRVSAALGVGAGSEFSDKSKKDRVGTLDAVGRVHCGQGETKMDCIVSEKDDLVLQRHPKNVGQPNSYMLPKKFSYEGNVVCHASVPRKLRSAMKKRNRESVSPSISDSEKPNHRNKECAKWSQVQGMIGPLTKDEEEVVETLFALAGMFPNSGMDDMSADGQSVTLDSSGLQDMNESLSTAFKASESANLARLSTCVVGPPEEVPKITSNELAVQEQPNLPCSGRKPIKCGGMDPLVNHQTMPYLVKSEDVNGSSLQTAVHPLDTVSTSQSSCFGSKPDTAVQKDTVFRCKQELPMKDSTNEHQGFSFPRLSAAKLPAWLDSALCDSRSSSNAKGSSSGRAPFFVNVRISWKKCATHVHITQLIRSLQKPNNKDELQLLPYAPQKVELKEANSSWMKKEFMSTISLGGPKMANHSSQGMDSIVRQKKIYDDRFPDVPLSGLCTPRNQNFDFSALSSGGNGLKTVNDFNKFEYGLQPLSQLGVPYFQSQTRHHGLVSYSMPQTQYTFPANADQIQAAGSQLQLPHVLGSPYSDPHRSPTISVQQQQQKFWTPQLAAHAGPAALGMTNQYTNWQSGRGDSPASSLYGQAMSSQVLLPKFTQVSQPQQQLIGVASFPTSRTNGFEFRLHSACDESRGKFSGSGTIPSQLLCNENLL